MACALDDVYQRMFMKLLWMARALKGDLDTSVMPFLVPIIVVVIISRPPTAQNHGSQPAKLQVGTCTRA